MKNRLGQNERMQKASIIFALALFLFSTQSFALIKHDLSLEEKISRQMKMIEAGVSLSPAMGDVAVGQAVENKKPTWAKYQNSQSHDAFCILQKGSRLEIQAFTSDSASAIAALLPPDRLKKETRTTEPKGFCRTGQIILVPLKALK